VKSRLIFARGLIAGTMLMACASAFANHPVDPPADPVPPVPVAVAVSDSTSHSNAAAIAASAAHSNSTSGANAVGTGGNATSSATGGRAVGIGAAAAGDSSASVGDTSSEANGSNTSNIDASTTYERQVGTLIMGTVIPVDCGFGGQAGGANTSGSGFLGASWTTDRCYTLKVANAWAAMGEYELACEMLSDVSRNAMKRRSKLSVDCMVVGAALRKAHTPQPVVTHDPYVAPDLTQYATKDYVDKVFKASVSK
jgi:hypothetical protein